MKTKHCPHGWPEIHQCRQCTIWKLETECTELNKKYDELIYAVARVFSNETRHETALRYIREAEARAIGFDDCPDAY